MTKTLQELRVKKELTQEQASKILDITKEYLSMLETGDRNPSDSLKEKMAKLYDCQIADIYSAINSTKRLKTARNNKTTKNMTISNCK